MKFMKIIIVNEKIDSYFEIIQRIINIYIIEYSNLLTFVLHLDIICFLLKDKLEFILKRDIFKVR